MKDAKTCMMIRGAADRVWLMKIWCVQWKSSFKRTDDQISRSLLHETVSDKLRFRKLSSRWVPKVLTDEHKMKRQARALTFPTRYSEQGDDFFSRIVTGDETWVSHVTPESKQQSMEWRHK
jgi:hypothetical protein